jgi:hypothetical protein
MFFQRTASALALLALAGCQADSIPSPAPEIAGVLGEPSSIVLPGTGTYTARAALPTPRTSTSSAVLNGKLYVIGGYVLSNGDLSKAVHAYDPNTDSWTARADAPLHTSYGVAATIGNFIYHTGGGASHLGSYLSRYSDVSNSWQARTAPPVNLIGPAIATVGRKLYIAGGRHSGSLADNYTMWAYDTLTNAWTQRANMPVGLELHSATSIGTKIYVAGGLMFSDGQPFTGLLVYDTQTDSWSTATGPGFPIYSTIPPFVAIDRTLYLFSDENGPKAYTPSTDSWVGLNFGSIRNQRAYGVIDGEIYMAGWYGGGEHDKFTPAFAGNHAPVGGHPGGPYAGTEGDEIEFNLGSEASDIDGDELTYVWDFGDGHTVTGESVNHIYTDDGNYDVSVVAFDPLGKKTIRTHTRARIRNARPQIASLAFNLDSVPLAGETMTATIDVADAGSDTWTFKVEIPAIGFSATTTSTEPTGNEVPLTLNASGSRRVRVIVSDDDGGADTTFAQIYVMDHMRVIYFMGIMTELSIPGPYQLNLQNHKGKAYNYMRAGNRYAARVEIQKWIGLVKKYADQDIIPDFFFDFFSKNPRRLMNLLPTSP